MKCLSFFWKKAGAREDAQRSSASSSCRGNSISCESSSAEASSKPSIRTIAALCEEKIGSLRAFDLSELHVATSGFSWRTKIGEGGFGSVYRGLLEPSDPQQSEIMQVAIKKLNQGSLQGHKEWMAEIQFLSVVDHPNLVKLVGYCGENTDRGIQRLLVYEFMPNKTLEDHLFTKVQPPLSWRTRLRVALGVAEGLRYLHEGLEIQVIYRDFKASNVLLDEDFEPKLSDFGLAREGPSDGRTHVSTAVVGTYGYAAPEYIKTGHLTTKSDVWSFGIVLFEILTGRRCLDLGRPRSERKLLDWVKEFPVESGRFTMIIDPRLQNRYSISASRYTANLANSCLSTNPKARPTMSQVVESLRHIIG
ncbi:unnamed protein product [Spirodela intermedia]|uniref:non-specific serine/threonine protein kinase n=1 Tax=Spirodela intermedia TaxID=51605 RepID=A0A7I8L2I5_SPIIN|nr:unnamed protein product [Spirodela intermedia]